MLKIIKYGLEIKGLSARDTGHVLALQDVILLHFQFPPSSLLIQWNAGQNPKQAFARNWWTDLKNDAEMQMISDHQDNFEKVERGRKTPIAWFWGL